MSYGHALSAAGRAADSDRRLPRAHRAGAEPGRSLLEPGQPQDLPLQRRRSCGDARRSWHAPIWARRSACISLRPGQGAGGRAATTPSRSTTTREGNALRRTARHYDAGRTDAPACERSQALFTRSSSRPRAGFGHRRRDPIFIVGLPRAGSTLIEQILASHSQVEGTMELPDIIAIARELGGRRATRTRRRYPEVAGGA